MILRHSLPKDRRGQSMRLAMGLMMRPALQVRLDTRCARDSSILIYTCQTPKDPGCEACHLRRPLNVFRLLLTSSPPFRCSRLPWTHSLLYSEAPPSNYHLPTFSNAAWPDLKTAVTSHRIY